MVGLTLRTGLGLDANPGGSTSGGGPPAYEGPLDLVPGAVVAYSATRALSAARRGSPLYTIEKNGADPTIFNADASDGAAPIAAIEAFLGEDDGTVTIWNDQSGNDLDLLSQGSSPGWEAGVINDLPGVVDFESTGFLTSDPGTVTVDFNEATVFMVCKGATQFFLGNWASSLEKVTFSLVSGLSVRLTVNADTLGEDFTANPASVALFDAFLELNATVAARNGTALVGLGLTNTPITPDFTDAVVLDLASSGGGGKICEVIVYGSKLTDPQRLAIRQNIAAYYGIAL